MRKHSSTSHIFHSMQWKPFLVMICEIVFFKQCGDLDVDVDLYVHWDGDEDKDWDGYVDVSFDRVGLVSI